MRFVSRLTAIILSITMMLSLLPLSATAQTALVEEDFSYKISEDDKTVTIISYNGSDEAVTIPSAIAGLPVTVIGSAAFEANMTIKSVTLPDTLEIIESNAFNACTKLTAIDIPDSVEAIRSMAFYNCLSLSDITIGSATYDIGYQAFHQTAWLNSSPDGPAYLGRVLYTYNGVMSENAVVTVKDGTAAIAPYAFSGRKTLKTVYLPVGIRAIGSCAFMNCTILSDIRIPPSVTIIGSDIFLNADIVTVHGVTDTAAHACAIEQKVEFSYDETLDYLDGDLNKDKLVNSTDIRLALRVLVDPNVTHDRERFSSCDFVYDGTIDSTDVHALLRILIGL